MPVGFFPPIIRSFVFQIPALKLFNQKKEIEPEKIMGHNWYFVVSFSNFQVAKTMCVPQYFVGNVRVMYVSFIAHYSS